MMPCVYRHFRNKALQKGTPATVPINNSGSGNNVIPRTFLWITATADDASQKKSTGKRGKQMYRSRVQMCKQVEA